MDIISVTLCVPICTSARVSGKRETRRYSNQLPSTLSLSSFAASVTVAIAAATVQGNKCSSAAVAALPQQQFWQEREGNQHSLIRSTEPLTLCSPLQCTLMTLSRSCGVSSLALFRLERRDRERHFAKSFLPRKERRERRERMPRGMGSKRTEFP